MNTQRLRNLTTGRLHTEMGHIYEDLEIITGQNGLMTHMLPRVINAVEPWLRKHVTNSRFWEDKYDPTHIGEIELPVPTQAERKEMIQIFLKQPNPLKGKTVIGVRV
jgi:hypothetical protein